MLLFQMLLCSDVFSRCCFSQFSDVVFFFRYWFFLRFFRTLFFFDNTLLVAGGGRVKGWAGADLFVGSKPVIVGAIGKQLIGDGWWIHPPRATHYFLGKREVAHLGPCGKFVWGGGSRQDHFAVVHHKVTMCMDVFMLACCLTSEDTFVPPFPLFFPAATQRSFHQFSQWYSPPPQISAHQTLGQTQPPLKSEPWKPLEMLVNAGRFPNLCSLCR